MPKTTSGAFASSNLSTVLAEHNVRTPVFIGADTAFCLESTVRRAVDHGFRSVVAEDACVSCYETLYKSTLLTLGFHLAYLTTNR